MRRPLLFTALAALGLAGCSGGGDSACTEETRKAAVLATARDWYLYQDLLPASIDPASYPTADALLAALTQPASEQGKDRGWSYLLTEQQYQQYFSNGQSPLTNPAPAAAEPGKTWPTQTLSRSCLSDPTPRISPRSEVS
jgi:hypothetical protein